MLIKEYHKRTWEVSDINEHLGTLLAYGNKVDRITEFGVGNSTYAFAAAKPKSLISYDIKPMSEEDMNNIKECGCFVFIQWDVLKIEIEPTDLLFIDTKHTYTQLIQELTLHGDRVSTYIILHDTKTFGEVGEGGDAGLNEAIHDFLKSRKGEWALKERFDNNNGLTILERTGGVS